MDEIQTLIDKTVSDLKSKYEIIGEGRNRIVFLKDEDTVIKCPLNDWGLSDNNSEFHRYLQFGKTKDIIKYAECSIFMMNGLGLLEMERVYPIEPKDVPSWADYVDCGQVGRNKNGEILAYDYA